jgi:hypothetical protein
MRLPACHAHCYPHPRARWGAVRAPGGQGMLHASHSLRWFGEVRRGRRNHRQYQLTSFEVIRAIPRVLLAAPSPRRPATRPPPTPQECSPPLHSPGGARNLLTPDPLESLNRRSGSDKVSSLALGESNAQTALALDEVSSLRSIVYDPPTPLGCSPPLHRPRGGSQF